MIKESERDLMAYGRTLMARVAGREPGADPPWVGKFLDLLNPNRAAIAADGPLCSIFTLIELEGDKADPGYLRAVPLDLEDDGEGNWRWMPIGLAEAPSDRVALHRLFVAADVPQGDFIRFFHLMRKYATALPNTYGEPGVSLFEQWKMVAALVGISGSTAQTPRPSGWWAAIFPASSGPSTLSRRRARPKRSAAGRRSSSYWATRWWNGCWTS